MRHARSDYDRIQDPAGLIPDDEPVFLLRGKDGAAPAAVRAWAHAAEAMGASRHMVAKALEHAAAMEQYQREHSSDVPDMPTE